MDSLDIKRALSKDEFTHNAETLIQRIEQLEARVKQLEETVRQLSRQTIGSMLVG